jgi:carbonic anhydrase/acetyltransferase-like protein (isoleucine patch superfamily)
MDKIRDVSKIEKKYEILKDRSLAMNGSEIYRIRALKDFGDVKAGDIGGYVASEENLSHEGPCWVYDIAMVYHNAKVKDNAIVRDCAHVYNEAQVFHNAIVEGHARVFGYGSVFGNAKIKDNGSVFDQGAVHGSAIVQDNATVKDHARVCNEGIIKDYAYASGDIMVSRGTISNSTVLFGVGEINFDVNARDDWTFYRNPCVDAGFITTSTKIDVWNYRFFSGTAKEFINMFERVEDHHRIPGELEFIKALVKFHQDLYFKA